MAGPKNWGDPICFGFNEILNPDEIDVSAGSLSMSFW